MFFVTLSKSVPTVNEGRAGEASGAAQRRRAFAIKSVSPYIFIICTFPLCSLITRQHTRLSLFALCLPNQAVRYIKLREGEGGPKVTVEPAMFSFGNEIWVGVGGCAMVCVLFGTASPHMIICFQNENSEERDLRPVSLITGLPCFCF